MYLLKLFIMDSF